MENLIKTKKNTKMIIPRQKTFSNTFDENRFRRNSLIGLIMSVITVAGGLILNNKTFKNNAALGRNKTVSKELTRRLLDYIKKTSKGEVTIINLKKKQCTYLECSSISIPGELTKEEITEIKREARLLELDIEHPKTDVEWSLWSALNKKCVILYYPNDNPIVLAHEFGHYLEENRKKGKFMDKHIDTTLEGLANFVSLFLGFFGPVGVAVSILTGMATKSSELYNEYRASWYAVQILKEIGATEEELKFAKKYYRTAFSTYASNAVTTGGFISSAGSVLRAALLTDWKKER